MGIFDWFDRQNRLAKRKKNLGEKYTSDLTTRKFTTQDLQELNLDIDFSEIEYIYQIGCVLGFRDIIKSRKIRFIRY